MSGRLPHSLTLCALLLVACAKTTQAPQTNPTAAQAPAEAAAPAAAPPFVVTTRGSGPDLVLIPGLSNGAEALETVAAHYEGSFTVHSLTLAGFAGAPPLEGEAFLPVVKDALVEYVRGLDGAVLMGHSLGATLSMWVASEAPDAVRAVVAIDGVPYLPALMQPGVSPEAAMGNGEAMRAQTAGLDPAAFCQMTRYTLSTMIVSPDEQAAVAKTACETTPRAAGQAMYELFALDLRPAMAKVSAPILLMGAGAFATSPEILASVKAAYEDQVFAAPNASVVIVEGARHYVFLDQPEVFFATADAFVDGLEPQHD